jgi:hypothetical protein
VTRRPNRAAALGLLLAGLLVLAGCQPETNPAAVVAGTDRADWLPEHYVVAPGSDTAPRPDGEAIVFRLDPGERVSALAGGSIYRLGHQYLYSLEVFVPADFAARAGSARFSLARWRGAGGAAPRLFQLALDARRGVTFRGRTCVAPSGFGQWQQIYLRVRWAAEATGFLELRCGRGQAYNAPLVHVESDVATARGDRGGGALADRFAFRLGLMQEAGRPTQPVEVRMRRIAERRLYVVFNPPGAP